MNTQQDPRAAYRLSNRNKSVVEKQEPSALSVENEQQNTQPVDPPQNIQEPKQLEQVKDPRAAYRIPTAESYENDDDLDRMVERNIAGLTSRGIEQLVGFPGNMREFAKTVKDLVHSDKVLNKLKKEEPESFKKFDQKLKESPVIGSLLNLIPAIGGLINWWPTSSELREKSENITQGYTKPTDEVSKIGHEIFEDVISSVLPGQGQRNIFRNVAIPVLSVLAKEGTKYLGVGEKGQMATKFGVNFLLNMMNRSNGPRFNRELWDQVQNNAPNVNVLPSQNSQLLNQARQLEHQLTLGLGSPSETSALRTVRTFIEKLTQPNQTISAAELAASNRSLNEIAGDPALLQRGRILLNELRDTIHQGIDYVGHQSPDWVRMWRNANETHGAIQNSNFVANYINNNYSKPLVSEGVRALFGMGPQGKIITATAAAPIFGIYKGVQVLNRMAHSPILDRHYMNAILGSLRGNAAMMTSNLEKLDNELSKKEKKIPYK